MKNTRGAVWGVVVLGLVAALWYYGPWRTVRDESSPLATVEAPAGIGAPASTVPPEPAIAPPATYAPSTDDTPPQPVPTPELTQDAPQNLTVTGVVVDNLGRPLSGANVYLRPARVPTLGDGSVSPEDQPVTRCSSDGAFRLEGLPPDGIVVTAWHPGYISSTVAATPDGDSSTHVRIVLRQAASVQGCVRLEGRPLEGARLILENADEGGPEWKTGADGRYQFADAAPGDALLWLRWKDGGYSIAKTRQVHLFEGGPVTVDFDLQPQANAAIEGYVTCNGRPVANMTVRAHIANPEEEYLSEYTYVDARGYYRLDGLPVGTGELRIGSAVGERVVPVQTLSYRVVRKDVSYGGSVRGVIENFPEGVGGTGVIAVRGVIAVPELVQQHWEQYPNWEVVAGAGIHGDGTFDLPLLPPGTYTIIAVIEMERHTSAVVEVGESGQTSVTLRLPEAVRTAE